MNYYEISQRIKATAKGRMPAGEYNRLCNDVDRIMCGIKKGIERRPPAQLDVYDEPPLFLQTQEDAVLGRMLAGQVLDAMDGLNLPDIRTMQLRTVICRLRKKGIDITGEWVKLGSGKRAKRYYMSAEQREDYKNNN